MENEVKMDGRVSPEVLLEKRKLVICLYKKGMKLKEISEATGLCWQAVRNAIDLYEQHGVKGLKPGTLIPIFRDNLSRIFTKHP